MSNPAVILNGDQIYLEELVRENARLTVQHEADLLRADQLEAELEEVKAAVPSAQEALEACDRAQNRARTAEAKLAQVNALLARAIDDLHFVMAGGGPCKVCIVKCAFGTGECKPVWKGEEKAETEEAADQ